MTDVTYRRSTAADAPIVFRLVLDAVRRLAPNPYSQDVVDTWMAGRVVGDYLQDCSSQKIWLAELVNQPIGFAHGVPGEISRLFVGSSHIGLGAGAGLMRHALNDALTQGTGHVKIDATLNAVPFYQKWGFTKVGTGVFSGRNASLPPIEIVKMKKNFSNNQEP